MILAAVSRSTFRSVRSSSTKVSSFGLNRPPDSIKVDGNGERRGAQFLRNGCCCCLDNAGDFLTH